MTKDNWIKAEWDNFETRFWDYVCEESAYGETDVDNKRLKEIFLDAIEKTKRKCEDLHKNDPTPEDIRELMESVEKETVEKTNKRWESELYRIANEWDDELSELQGLPPHQHNPKMWSIVTNILSRMKSDLLEDKHED